MAGLNLIKSCESCSCGWMNFRHLTKNELQLLNLNRYEATFKPGEIMVKQGSPTSNALFMSAGLSKIYIEGSRGKIYTLEVKPFSGKFKLHDSYIEMGYGKE